MINIEKARMIYGKEGEKYTDEEMATICTGAEVMADIFIEGMLEKDEKVSLVPKKKPVKKRRVK